MHRTRSYFTHDGLLGCVYIRIKTALTRVGVQEVARSGFSNAELFMNGLAVFTFKFSSLLSFDRATMPGSIMAANLKTLFKLKSQTSSCACETRWWEEGCSVLCGSSPAYFCGHAWM